METDRFMQLSLTRSLSYGFLQCGWVHMVATQGVVRWVMTQFAGREQVVPAQLQRSIRVFASQRERKMHSGIVWNLAVRQKAALHIGNLLTQRLEQFRGEGYPAMFTAFGIPDVDAQRVKVEILYPQAHDLH